MKLKSALDKVKEDETTLTKEALLMSYQFDYGINIKDRIIRITGDIDDSTFDVFDIAMTELESRNKKTVTVKINSWGGDPYQALAIVSRMQESKCLVDTKGYGPIASAATLILAAGTRQRSISALSSFMHHETYYNAEGKHTEVVNLVAEMERQERLWCEVMSGLTNKDSVFWRKLGKNKDAYLTPDQLLEFGVIDKIF